MDIRKKTSLNIYGLRTPETLAGMKEKVEKAKDKIIDEAENVKIGGGSYNWASTKQITIDKRISKSRAKAKLAKQARNINHRNNKK